MTSIPKENNPKDTQDNDDRKQFFSRARNPINSIVKENGALSEVDGYYCTYSCGGRLDLLGWRALQCVGHFAESTWLMQAAG